ncbi:anthranilate phosphoribosyltransferase [Actinokineospora pegani]|uniref:anthranilate phosphoribosyltransferase n=1 Tax=Actinokineospora pegani TaxID=2654637 RepID=UPI0012E9E06D|nr:anthranilate phosphoribosyltransferase [Actinokineospora pegani]
MIEQLRVLARGRALDEEGAAAAMRAVMSGTTDPARVAGFAMALTARGETVDEIVGLARAAREAAVPVAVPDGLLDTCGTGGDGSGTFNISTTAAVVAAACGVPVAKHGNRAASSSCGSADVLEELGVRIDLEPRAAADCLDRTGITFLFAPLYHPALAHAAAVRRALGVRTVFNLIGPLVNPARARYQVLGVAEARLVAPLAEALARLGVHRAMVFHSADGMDELNTSAPADVVEVVGGETRAYRFDPAELSLPVAAPGVLDGGDRVTNAAIIRRVLDGEPGPAADVVVLNAAAALRVAGRVETWAEGLEQARGVLVDGSARSTLDAWVQVSSREPARGVA